MGEDLRKLLKKRLLVRKCWLVAQNACVTVPLTFSTTVLSVALQGSMTTPIYASRVVGGLHDMP